MRAVSTNRVQGSGQSVGQLTAHFGYSRDAYYKALRRAHRQADQTDTVLALVHREKALQPFLSGKKVYRLIQPDLHRQGVKLGRDKLYDLLREYGLLGVRPQRSCRTTYSRHGWRRYTNLLIDKQIDAPNQVWVADITYLRTRTGFVYLCLIMDAYSRKILGWWVHDSLEMEGCQQALRLALRTLPKGFAAQDLIHHSDQGVQYCCQAYTQLLAQRQIQISMASVGNCYENAQAERLNGILKQEYGLGQTLADKEQAKQLCAQAVELYNTRRPHCALQMHFPDQVHAGLKTNVIMSWTKQRA